MDRLQKAAPLGVGFIGLGFLLIFISWNGAAAKDCVQCQIPYLISGGATGLGLIGIGCALLLFEASRRDRAHADARINELIEALRTTGPRTEVIAEPAAPTLATNGNTVVIGRSSFHRTDCRLVEGKDDLVYGSKSDATAQGLQPCRVCDPTQPSAPKKSTKR